MKKNFIFPFAAAVILLILFFISSTTKAPLIPDDERHRKLTTIEACASCHAPGKSAPLKKSHPPKEQCLVCHKTKR